MKRILSYILTIAAALAFLSGCAKPDSEFVHDDPTISSIYIVPVNPAISTTVAGEINQETGEILFPINKKIAEHYDITRLKVRANVGYDVKITPVLTGIHDLTEAKEITCTATMTGNSKKYTLRAYYSRNL